MHLVDGKAIARKIEKQIKKRIITPPTPSYLKRGGFGLAAILVGNDPASRLYVRLKEKAAKRVNIKFQKILYPTANCQLQTTNYEKLEEKIISKIQELNSRKDITGIIVQLPLPKYLNTNKIISTILPQKDADGFHPQNQKNAVSPVLRAAIEILKSTKTNWKNKKIILVSNSKVFPIPFQSYFEKNLQVVKFKDAKKYLPNADIIITAIGKKHYLKSGMVKKGVTIIDIGIVRKDKKIYGDADSVSLAKKASYLTPVPGGIGPITVACLLLNTIKKIT